MENKRKAVFIDRDGVVNKLIFRGENHIVQGKVCQWTGPYAFDEFVLYPGISEAVQIFKDLGFLAILVTNQPDVSYGLLPKDDYDKMFDVIKTFSFDDIFVCTHTRDESCECKKPKPGMLYTAAKKWDIDLLSSYIIGDHEKDMLAGKKAGCTTILIKRTYNKGTASDFAGESLFAAAMLVRKLEGGD